MTDHRVKVSKALPGWWAWHCCGCQQYAAYRHWRLAYDGGKFHADWFKEWSR